MVWLWGRGDLQPVLFNAACRDLSRGGRSGPSDAPPVSTPPPRHAQVFWEDGIMSGYRRPTSSARDCVLSSFQMTNETVNIWTHFLPTW